MIKIFNKIILFISLFIHISTYERYRDLIIDGKTFNFKSSFLVEEDTEINEGSIISEALDDITILVIKGQLTITPGRNISKIVKKNSVNGEVFHETDRYKYGLTSNIVAIGEKTKVVVNSAIIYVDCPFSNAIMAFNGAKIILKNTTIITKSDYSKGVVVAYNANFEITDNSKIITEGNFSPCLEAYKNNNQAIFGTNIYLFSDGLGSPLINNIGNAEVEIFVGIGKANNSQIMIMEEENQVYLDSCEFSCNVKEIIEKENPNLNSALNDAGIILYSKKGNAIDVIDLEFHHCKLKIENEEIVPIISCYNIQASITFEGTQTEFKDIFIKADKTKDSPIDSKIHLTLHNTYFKGKIIALEGSQIDLIADPNILENGIEIEGKVDIQ